MYLLRFDDVCPTMNWSTWQRIETALVARNIKPIVAVVPDNQDPELKIDAPAGDFWERVREWQSRGWTIAMHGYQHVKVNSRSGLMGITPFSEFAGLSNSEQESKLEKGVQILRREGIDAKTFVAPAHSFDKTTLKLLPRFGLRIVSDGFSLLPYASPEEIFWIPQQLWELVPKRSGVWTVCIHANAWTEADMERFILSLDDYRSRMSSVEEIERSYAGRAKSLRDRFHAWHYYIWQFGIRRRFGRAWRAIHR
jgi:predicted deacetylase